MKKITVFIFAALIAMAATSFVACKVACAGCLGTGECQYCDGTGKIDGTDTDDEGNKIKVECTVCKGSGDCRACDGKQKVKKSDNTEENKLKASNTDEDIEKIKKGIEEYKKELGL